MRNSKPSTSVRQGQDQDTPGHLPFIFPALTSQTDPSIVLPMNSRLLLAATLIVTANLAIAQIPENLVADGMPAIAPELRADAGRYLEFRAAGFNSWHPARRELLITTRFADTPQLHEVRMPGGARRQLTFTPEPVGGAVWQPKLGRYIVFMQDKGGGEFFQLFRLDPDSGRITLLTDGKSRNGGPRFTRSGSRIAYTSTRRNGRDSDIHALDPADPTTDKLVCEVSGGGWDVSDWSADESKVLLVEGISINKSRVHLLDVKSGVKELLTPDEAEPVANGNAKFSPDGKSVFFTSDKGSEFHRIVQMDLKTTRKVGMGGTGDSPVPSGHWPDGRRGTLAVEPSVRESAGSLPVPGGESPPGTGQWPVLPNGGAVRQLTPGLTWNVEEFDLSDDGKTIAFITNEDGVGRLRLLDVRSGKELRAPKLPLGIPSGISWHENNHEVAFTFTSARSATDVYSYDIKSGKVERWTESETGGLNTAGFVEPELIRVKSFDGYRCPAFCIARMQRGFPASDRSS